MYITFHEVYITFQISSTAYDREYKQTGATNETLRIDKKELDGDKMEVSYRRDMDESDVESWGGVRETGLSLRWWIEAPCFVISC